MMAQTLTAQGHDDGISREQWSAEFDGRTIGRAVVGNPTDIEGNAEVLMRYLSEHIENNAEHVPDFIGWYYRTSQS